MKRGTTALLGLLLLSSVGCYSPQDILTRPTLDILVMDPLADVMACDCVGGYASRDYHRLARFISGKMERPVQLHFAEDLETGLQEIHAKDWLVIGKDSVVRYDRQQLGGQPLTPLARLKGLDGTSNLTGLFVVAGDSPLASLKDVPANSVMLGPESNVEKDRLPRAALQAAGIELPATILRATDCTAAGLAVVDREVQVAVVSSYALPLVEGCGAIKSGQLKVIGKTKPAPFITLFASNGLSEEDQVAVKQALEAANKKRSLLKAMESKGGFELLPAESGVSIKPKLHPPDPGWTDWRGPRRDAFCETLPPTLPTKPRLIWEAPTSGNALAGVCANRERVIIADKSEDGTKDIFRCFDAVEGSPLWSVEYDAPGEMDFTNAPRATPLLHDGKAYLLGAYGHLHCVDATRGKILWKRQLIQEFGAKLVTWGMTATPLIVDDLLIVNPGAPEASLVALDRNTGTTRWKVPGEPAAYASFICSTFGGRRQIIGYDATTLGGWDPATGERLWSLTPPYDGDFNVPTPIACKEHLLVSTENNGTRLYGFDPEGRLLPEPLAQNEDLAPDTASPVRVGHLIFGTCSGLHGLDLNDQLKPRFKMEDAGFDDFCVLIGGPGRVLVMTAKAELLLLSTDADPKNPLPQRVLLFDQEVDVWTHPALIDDRFYLRAPAALYCFSLAN